MISTSSATDFDAIADDVRRHPLGDGDHVPADDEHPVVLAGDERLDQDVTAPGLVVGLLEGGPDLLLGVQVDRHATAVVAVQRLEHHGIADPAGHPDRVVGAADHLGGRHRQAGGGQQPVGQLLVGGDVDRQRGRQRRHGGPDPSLVDAVAQLHQRARIQPLPRDVAGDRLVQDGLGRRAERDPLARPQVVVVLGREVEIVVDDGVPRHQVIDQPDREPAGQGAHRLVEIAEDDVVDAVLAGGAGLAAGDLMTGGAFDLQGDVLDHVSGPGALDQPLDEPAVSAAGALVVVQAGEQRQE